ncbi:MAG: EAL domain-containing protein [Phycisphaerales bacterium]|nr:EAL domain-containing protein [Phycisphaerales bacterium]
MIDPHRNLDRQLRRHGLAQGQAPESAESWGGFLGAVNRAYLEHDRAVARMERALGISTAEMQTLYDELLARSEALARETARLEREMYRRAEVEERLRHEATHDALTSLPNRAKLLERIERRLPWVARHPGTTFALLFLDLDNFKIINDSLGHAAGDRLLTLVATRLQRGLRSLDTVVRPGSGFTARLGGDEFVVLLEEIADSSDALRVAERLRAEIAEPMVIDRHSVEVGASVGIAVYRHGATSSAADLLRESDTAMYFAKHSGKSRCAMFDERMHAAAVTRLSLENQLRAAVARGEFVVYYQPVIELSTGRMASAEALVRWQHPDGSLVSPGVFVTVAEEMGIIGELGRWVLNEACRQVAAWNRRLAPERQICVGVNVSRRQILDADLVADVRGALGASGLDARRLNIEITESIIMTDSRRAAGVLDAIRDTGVRVLMDDFGTGYSSLSCLHNFSVDGLKIDRSFVELLQSEGPYRAVVETIVRLAHVLEKRVVCEGIETPEQLQIVRELGCDFAQGFLFSRPVPGPEMERLLLDPGQSGALAA